MKDPTPQDAWDKAAKLISHGVTHSRLKAVLKPYPRILEAVRAVGYEKIKVSTEGVANQFKIVYEATR